MCHAETLWTYAIQFSQTEYMHSRGSTAVELPLQAGMMPTR